MILVIAEKPSAGRDYASVLGASIKRDGYLEGNGYLVSWAVGHLVSLKSPDDYKDDWKSWQVETLPMIPDKFEYKIVEGSLKKQFKVLKELINRVDVTEIINGGDAAREGELIQRLILQEAGNKKPVRRLWVSSMTNDAIEEGFQNLRNSSEFDTLFESAKLRSYADWLIGMNYTRGITKKFGSGKNVLSIGRCQTPLLKLIVDRDFENESFSKVPYFEVVANFQDSYTGKYVNPDGNSRFDKKDDAQALVTLITGKNGVVKDVKRENKSMPAPLLHNLTTLGQVLNRAYGYSANETLEILQGLYEKHKIVTYPRAGAKVISKSVFNDMKKNIGRLDFGDFSPFVKQMKIVESIRYVNDTKIEDHHAIIPDFKNPLISTIYPKLSQREKNVFDVVANSLIAAFMPNYDYISTTIETDVEKNLFVTNGTTVKKLGWRALLSDNSSEEVSSIPESIKIGDAYKVIQGKLLEKETKPKPRHTEASLLKEMEKYGIGTMATQAGLIETLKKRNYIETKGKALISTDLGRNLINSIPLDYIKDIEYTAILEKDLKEVAEGNMNPLEALKRIVAEINKGVDEIKSQKVEMKMAYSDDALGTCPFCNVGQIVKGKTKQFYCNNYKSGCKFYVDKVLGKKISEAQVKKLITKNNTGLIKGFISPKTNKEFDAELILKDGKITFNFGTPTETKESNIMCPVCNKPLSINDKVAKCPDEHILIFREIAGKKISEKQIKDLILKKETDEIKGFKSKKGSLFAAKIILNNDGKTEFKFG